MNHDGQPVFLPLGPQSRPEVVAWGGVKRSETKPQEQRSLFSAPRRAGEFRE